MSFNPENVNLSTASKEDVLCYFALSENDYNGHIGARISSIFVILFVSSAFTVFPVLAKRFPSWKIPFGVYLFARYFGTGVIVATSTSTACTRMKKPPMSSSARNTPQTKQLHPTAT